MKKLLSLAVGAMMMLGISTSQQAKAQVYADFDLSLREGIPYETLVEGASDVTLLNASEFKVPPTYTLSNADEGYCLVDLGTLAVPFVFNYNGVDYTKVWVSVNGFISFDAPPNVFANQQEALFTIENSYADNIVAPFFGDHIYRQDSDNPTTPGANKWAPSKILIKRTADKVVIEWKDLNILDKNVTSSIATFQVILYKSTNANSKQGAIEFAYNTSGKKNGQQTSETQVITTGASIGIKGDFGMLHGPADYMNALFATTNKNQQITSVSYSEEWQPTGGSDKRFHFEPYYRYTIGSNWGDGDADMSRVVGKKHFGISEQNRYVTVNDAREIVQSIAKNIPLDSIKGRSAFHGDVNHNGRFIYTVGGSKYFIDWSSKEYNNDLPASMIGNERQIMFRVTEHDAAYIMHYLAGRIPQLPWYWDFPQYGKQDENTNQISFGNLEDNNGEYTFVLRNNQYINGPFSSKFDVNAEVVAVTDLSGEKLSYKVENGRVVLFGDGEFSNNEPICQVTVRSTNKEVEILNARVNDVELNNFTLKLAGENTTFNGMSNYPNPFAGITAINVNITNEDVYTLSVFDAKGNLVKTVVSQAMKAGLNSFTWDGTDNSGNAVESGMYIYRLTGNGRTVSNQMMLVK